ncbi:MAG: hypothetical protein ACRENB_06885 [Gemmatimonadales bacterium]
MTDIRISPFELLFGDHPDEPLARIRAGAEEAGRDPASRDEFVLVKEVVELLHGLRPDEGLGEAVDALVAFVHTAYLYWRDGLRVLPVERAELAARIASRPEDPGAREASTVYVQLPPLVVWGTPVAGGPAEPLDGWFARREEDHLRVLAVFGLRPGREELVTVELEGPRPSAHLERADGTPLFAPRVAGGAAAELHAIDGEEELLELAWRLDPGERPGNPSSLSEVASA